MVKQDGNKDVNKDGKTGWQNLYIGKNIEKRGGGTCILIKKMVKQDGRTCLYEKRLKKGAAEHVYYVRDVKTVWQNLYLG